MTLLFTFISLLVLFLSAYLYRVASGENIWNLNMLNYSFVIIFLVAYISSTIILLDLHIFGYSSTNMSKTILGNNSRKIYIWVIVMWTMIGIPIGAILINLFSKGKSIDVLMKKYKTSNFLLNLGLSERNFFLVIMVSTFIISFYNYIFRPEFNAIDAITKGASVVEGQIIRRSAIQGSGNLILDILFNTGTLTMLNLISYVMMLNLRARHWRFLFIFGFLLITYLSLLVGNVTTILMYLVVLGFTRTMVKGVFLRLYEGLAVLIFIAFLFSFLKGYGDYSVFQVLYQYVLTRVVFSQISGTFFALEVFPIQHDFLWFSSTGKELHSIMNLNFEESYGIVMMRFYNPEGIEAGSAGHFTTIFMGEAWANFGFLGIILAPLWVGGLLQSLNRWIINKSKNAIAIAIYTYLTVSFGYTSDFIGFYYPLGTISLLVGFFFTLWSIKYILVHKVKNIKSIH